MSIRVRGPEIPVGALSGGNQQKVLLSRLLETQPRVLILDEPTRGVDIGAKSELYRIIDELAKGGAAVLVISSELPEIVGIADRVVVMREGLTVGEVGGGSGVPITEETIMALATGVELERWRHERRRQRRQHRRTGAPGPHARLRARRSACCRC